MDNYYSIGEVAKLTSATIKTIRYYDDIHLLPASHISPAGYRYYTQEDIWQLELILLLRYLGFKVQDIKRMLQNEIPVSTSINWQLGIIESQMSHLGQIRDILAQASRQDDANAQLNYLHDIAEIIHKSTKQRQDLIASTLHASFIEPNVPQDWKEHVLTTYIGFVPEEHRLSEKQLSAWSQMNALLQDASFVEEIQRSLGTFWQGVNEQDIEASPWQKKYTRITKTVIDLMQASKTEIDPAMQTAALDYVSLFQPADTALDTERLQQFIQHSDDMSSERLNQWWQLLLVMNPSLAPYADAQHMIKRTVLWLIAHPERVHPGGEGQ
ncbi:MerR family transcriptional regulator [Paenibacillus guangzhouensis]|uniref:MerR family transcriptional regulator n=1 Tax=Paenibacillus guangzhouensis TaxID=1473112 RepID=UPI0012675345|nr:MerR family transcriptional regulator [Paenibacillus guangzhouensis]